MGLLLPEVVVVLVVILLSVLPSDVPKEDRLASGLEEPGTINVFDCDVDAIEDPDP
jgi:hypothetical protein